MSSQVSTLFQLYRDRGGAQYGGEAVTQLAHALQCATLAEQAGASAALVTASLFHDLGHLVHHLGADVALRGIDDRHEYRAVPYLENLFSPAVTRPIQLHVAAKRYLCAVDREYWAALSPASQRSLELQGGIFSDGEAAVFIQQPHAADAVKLRRWDDQAKVPHQPTPILEHFEAIAQTIVRD
ncbi:MAG: phosphohydrolase [Leptolyngbya sp. SIOISBB]|nr:phosphohydrolase [Leptolyngbya sp. SIOISBB]